MKRHGTQTTAVLRVPQCRSLEGARRACKGLQRVANDQRGKSRVAAKILWGAKSQ